MLWMMLTLPHAFSQMHTPSISIDSTFRHSASFGPSYGVMLERPADYWGLSMAYAYKLNGPFVLSPSIAYDQEIDRSNADKKVVNTFSLLATVSYFVSRRFSLTGGFAKGISDDDNEGKRLQWVNGDWNTGISLGYSLPDFPFWTRDSFIISGSFEYNLTKNEFSVSFDLTFGISW